MNLIVKRVVILLLALHTVFCGNAQDFCIIEDGYAYFHNHPKTNGIDFKVRIPKNWKIEEGNRPHIVAKITNDDLSTFLIIINKSSTFISRNMAKQIYTEGGIEQYLFEEYRTRFYYTELLDTTDVYIDSYPTRQSVFYNIKDVLYGSKTIKLECIDTVWTMFYEDSLIQFMTTCPKADYEKISFVFNEIAHSIVIFDHYDQ